MKKEKILFFFSLFFLNFVSAYQTYYGGGGSFSFSEFLNEINPNDLFVVATLPAVVAKS